jgi:hypothetical protein
MNIKKLLLLIHSLDLKTKFPYTYCLIIDNLKCTILKIKDDIVLVEDTRQEHYYLSISNIKSIKIHDKIELINSYLKDFILDEIDVVR